MNLPRWLFETENLLPLACTIMLAVVYIVHAVFISPVVDKADLDRGLPKGRMLIDLVAYCRLSRGQGRSMPVCVVAIGCWALFFGSLLAVLVMALVYRWAA